MINQKFIDEALNQARNEAINGTVASYIPELSKAKFDDLGICIADLEGNCIGGGDMDRKFTIQSVSKPFTLILALMDNDEKTVFEKVGKEPTGDPFNSVIRLETYTMRKPLNPMINAGAITIASLIKGRDNDEKIGRVLKLMKKMSANPSLSINMDVYSSEKATGDRNRAIGHFLKDIGNINGNVDEVLDLYFMQCSIEVSAKDLARMGLVLANDGKDPETGNEIVPKRYARIAKSFMATCGMYDESGEYAINVGIPSKSGVGGGVMCSVPGKYGIGVYGPSLNDKGNSVAGMNLLERISREYNLSIF